MSLPVPRIEDPWQQRKPVFIAFGIIGVLLGILWIWGGLVTGQTHPAHILRAIHDGPRPQPPPGAPSGSQSVPLPEVKLYGKLVDESGMPIPDATVRLTLRDASGTPEQIERTTSTDGHFSIHGQRAATLQVEVTSPGYSNIPFPSEGGAISGATFDYASNPSLLKLHATLATPLVLTLWQPPRPTGTAPDQHFPSAKLDPTGLPHQIKVRDRTGGALHTIEIRYWNDNGKGRRTGKNPYSWNATLFVHGGTLIEKPPAQIKPEAPATGYLPGISIDFPATLPRADWKNQITRHYFIRFADNTHGILTLKFDSSRHTLDSTLIRNPKPNDTDLTGTYLFK